MNKQKAPSEKLNVPIRRFITKRVISINKNASIREGAVRMVEFGISSLGILEDGKVSGIVTDSDLKKRALSVGKSPEDPIEDIMTTPVIAADINSTIEAALSLMSKHTIKHVLVSEQNEIVGITTLKDLENLDLQELETLIARD